MGVFKYEYDFNEISKRVNNRDSCAEIANDIGCAKTTLYLYCKNNNITWPDKFDIGYSFNMLTVEKKLESRGESGHQSIYWLCRCKCGGTKELTTRDITASKYISCGCWIKSKEYKESHYMWTGHEGIHGKWWSGVKRGAKKRGHCFDIDIQWAWDLYITQGRECALSGVPIVFASSMKLVQSGNTTASIDRKDSNVGYTEDNVQWVHKDINMMKQKMSNNELIKYCKLIVEYNK